MLLTLSVSKAKAKTKSESPKLDSEIYELKEKHLCGLLAIAGATEISPG